MDKKQRLFEMRKSNKLKGLKPCFIFLKNNVGKMYNGGRANFIMSYNKETLYFQKLTFFNNLSEKEDFEINAKRFINYQMFDFGITKMLTLVDKNGMFIQVFYKVRRKSSITTEDNIERILAELKKLGIKEVDLDAEAD